MSSSSLTSLSSSLSLGSVNSRTRALIEENSSASIASSSRASSTAPTDADSSAIATPSQTPARSRRRTRSTPVTTQATYGPRHLEHEYSRAYEELRSVTIYALYRLGYTNPKRKSPDDEVDIPTLPMVLAAKFPDVERARKMVNEADRKLSEALALGQSWENTPWPSSRASVDGIATEAAEVAGENDDVDDDVDERELREVWARFVAKESERELSGKDLGSAMVANGGRRKRKCREDTEEIRQPDRQQRRRLDPSTSDGSAAYKGTGSSRVASAKAMASSELTPLPGRRVGLRSAKTVRPH